MAENSKGGGLFTSAKKNLIRKKTQVLQSLGKTGKTTDDILAEDYQKLEKQQEVATKFQKDLRHYIQNARSLSHASKQFYTTAAETYEEEWENHGKVVDVCKNMDMLWEDYLQKLHDQIQEPLQKYLACIPQIKARIAKRGRKMIDYDNAKHNLEVQQNAKKKDDAKIAKAQEDLDNAKKIYEDLNNDLHQELPEFCNSRLPFYGNLFENLFSAENVFYTEAGKGCQEVMVAGQKLANDNEDHTYKPRKSVRNTIIVGSDENLVNGTSDSGPDSPHPDSPSPSTPGSPADQTLPNDTSVTHENNKSPEKSPEPAVAKEEVTPESSADNDKDTDKVEEKPDDTESKSAEAESNEEAATTDKKEEEQPQVNGEVETSTSTEPGLPEITPPPVPVTPPPEDESAQNSKESVVETEPAKPDSEQAKTDIEPVKPDSEPAKPASDPAKEVEQKANGEQEEGEGENEDLYQIPPAPKPLNGVEQPKNTLFLVCASHKYEGEDEDELSFDMNELIYVLPFENEDEQKKINEKKKSDQDEGWLMGQKKSTGQCGVFPENFTKRVTEPSET